MVKSKKTSLIREGKIKGRNLKDPPTTKRPAPPKAQVISKKKNPMFSDKQESKSWVINVVADPENPDFALIEFPEDFVESSGWQDGDKIGVEVLPDGILLRKLPKN